MGNEAVELMAMVLQPAADQPWAYDMKFSDVDGNVLWLGTGQKKR